MKKCVDGKYVEMTEEEIAILKEQVDETSNIPSVLERIEAIEAAILEGVLIGD